MATSKIYIYDTKITPERNALVDDIETYLGTLTPKYSNTSFQYLKLALDMTVTIEATQDHILLHNCGNYVKIVQDNKTWYYFLINLEWKSTKAIQLKLSIDSINTFSSDLVWSDKTNILRSHKDRYQHGYIFNSATISSVILNTEMWVKNFDSVSGLGRLQTDGNNILFKTYKKGPYGEFELKSSTSIGRIGVNYGSSELVTYIYEGSNFRRDKAVTFDQYDPDNEI